MGSFRGSEDRETKPTFVNRPVVRKPEMNQSAFAPSPTALPPPMLPSCHAPVTPTGHTSVSLTTHPPVAPTGHSTVNLTDPRLRFARPEGSPGVLSRVPSEDQWLLAQLATFLPKESSPVEHRLPGLSQGLEIPAISETPLEDAPLTPDAEWERRLGHCTFDWPTESAKKAEGFPSVRPGTFTEALLDVPSADDTCRFLGGAEYGLPGLGSYHNQVPGLGNLCI